MKSRLLLYLLCVVFSLPFFAFSAEKDSVFRFAVIDQTKLDGASHFQDELNRIRYHRLSFVVIKGVRSEREPCTDAVFNERRKLLEEAGMPLVLSLSGSDWINCRNENDEDIRIERLERLREVFFEEGNSFGVGSIPLSRQSQVTRYRYFPENAFWRYEGILFTTLHLPADNNHYSEAAGRNNEFEERLAANRYWLRRVFTLGKRYNLSGIVIFSDGNPFAVPAPHTATTRDGFMEVRRLMTQLVEQFPGKVLVIYGNATQEYTAISWRNNLGQVAPGTDWLEIVVNTESDVLFYQGTPFVDGSPVSGEWNFRVTD